MSVGLDPQPSRAVDQPGAADEEPTIVDGLGPGARWGGRDPVPVALWVGFVALAVATFAVWEAQGLYRVVGDEPHYLVMADGIVRDGTFEQTETYEREFDEQIIYPGGLAPAGSPAVPETTHALVGPNGLYNIHNVGLPLVLALPWVVGGLVGAKLTLILITSLVVPLTWRFSGRFSDDRRVRAFSTLAATWSLPFVLGANQVFPDLPAGVLALVAVDRVFALDATGSSGGAAGVDRVEPGTRRLADGLAIAAVAYLPWLQIKFSAAALLAAAALALQWWRADRPVGWVLGRLAPIGVSLGLLGIYNLHAFDEATGPYSEGALQISVQSMAVLAGLHLDRFQGLLIQNPAYLAGLLFALPLVRRFPVPGALTVLVYGSFVVPNALHPAWYGGTAFAGRFFWSGAVVALPVVIHGLVRLAELSRRAWLALTSLSLGAAGITWASLLIGPGDLYNRQPELSYPALFPVGRWLLPAFRDPEEAFRLPTNLVFLALALGLIAVGARFAVRGAVTLTDVRLAGGFVALCGVGVAAAGLVAPYREPSVLRAGAELEGEVGEVAGRWRTVTEENGRGWLNSRSYIGIWRDEYRYRVELDATGGVEGHPVGLVEVFAPQSGTILRSHDVWAEERDGPQVFEGRFAVPDGLDSQLLEVRTLYHGHGEITVRSIELAVP